MIFPGEHWDYVETGGLEKARSELYQHSDDKSYRVVVVKSGQVVAEWNKDIDRDDHQRLASATKSIFSSILAIAIDEGKIPSADAKVVDFYPEMMDVPDGEGPKPGRYAFEKDRDITFRQLISNTSGYMKPGEEPGKVFHYQTYGMNILTHAIAKAYGLYDSSDPEGTPGLEPLVTDRLREPLQASWSYYRANFDLHPVARLNIFGYYDGVNATALDMARLGWLWCNRGQWGEQQLIPEAWLGEAAQVAPAICENCPPEEWQYGYGFWSNSEGKLWPNLPREGFGAFGAGRQSIVMFPSLELVVVQSPSLWERADNEFADFLGMVEGMK